MKNFLFLTSLCLSFFITAPSLAEQGTDAQSSEVVFMRSSMVGKFIKATIYEVTDGEIKFIGIMSNKRKITYKTTPGKHTFMVVSEAADFMEAELDAGKTYYSIITPRMGAWKARFSLWPIRNDGTTKFNTDSKDFKKWMKKAKDHKPAEKDFKWFEKHRANVAEKMEKYWPVWQEKTAEDLAERTLNADDGVTL
ncbi:MAG: hypothetical protein ACSHWU_00685 [Marinicella sp.]